MALCFMACVVFGCPCAPDETKTAHLRHTAEWIDARLVSMFVVDDAYLWHDVLGGRAIHQNSSANPPTEPLEGNFHTQQQSFFALLKLHMYELGGARDGKLLDDAEILLDWVVDNGFDDELTYFYFRYNERKGNWLKHLYPEFNMFTVTTLLRYTAHRREPHYREIAERVFNTITRLAWDDGCGGFMHGFKPDPETGKLTSDGSKTLYGNGYLALLLLDVYDATGNEQYKSWARRAADFANKRLWDDEYHGWFLQVNRHCDPPEHHTKFTHINADMVQANYLLYLLGCGDGYLDYAEKGLGFLVDHSRMSNNLWAKHNARDGSDYASEHDISGSDTGGTHPAYDRQMQMITALCLGWRATGNQRYLDLIDDTLDAMERNHKIVYPAGVNYGYGSSEEGQNTWCHLWGLKGFMSIKRIQAGTPGW